MKRREKSKALDLFKALLSGDAPTRVPRCAESTILKWTKAHHVAGMLYPHRSLFSNQELLSHLNSAFQLNRQRNLIFLQEYKSICEVCEQRQIPKPAALKGLALLNRIYNLGERQLTDIDILLPAQYTAAFVDTLLGLGYLEAPEKKWHANRHKTVFHKTFAGLEITLELHSKLFYQEPEGYYWHLQTNGAMHTLTDTGTLLHLIGHLAHQHTFLKLFWLVDIDRVLRGSSGAEIKQLYAAAKPLGLQNSALFALTALNHFFGRTLPSPVETFNRGKILTVDLLVEPENHRWRYLALKHFIKDSFYESLEYDVHWALQRWQEPPNAPLG